MVIYKSDIINFYKSHNLKAYIFVLVFLVAFLTILFMVFILTLFAKAIGFTVIALLNTFKVLDIDGIKDVTTTTLNGQAGNISTKPYDLPVLGRLDVK